MSYLALTEGKNSSSEPGDFFYQKNKKISNLINLLMHGDINLHRYVPINLGRRENWDLVLLKNSVAIYMKKTRKETQKKGEKITHPSKSIPRRGQQPMKTETKNK